VDLIKEEEEAELGEELKEEEEPVEENRVSDSESGSDWLSKSTDSSEPHLTTGDPVAAMNEVVL